MVQVQDSGVVGGEQSGRGVSTERQQALAELQAHLLKLSCACLQALLTHTHKGRGRRYRERGREDGWRCEKDRERKGEEGVEREVSLFNNVDLEHFDMQHAACVFALVNQC